MVVNHVCHITFCCFSLSLFSIINTPALQFPHFVYQQSSSALQFAQRSDLPSCLDISLYYRRRRCLLRLSISLCSSRFFLLPCSTASRPPLVHYPAARCNRFQNPTTHARARRRRLLYLLLLLLLPPLPPPPPPPPPPSPSSLFHHHLATSYRSICPLAFQSVPSLRRNWQPVHGDMVQELVIRTAEW